MDKEYAKKILEETRENYNLTAESYTRTRAFISEDIKSLADYAQKGDKVLDSGCASGRFYGVLAGKGIDYLGVDISEELIKIARRNYLGVRFEVANALELPFPDDSFDKIFSISVIHNIPSYGFRIQYLKESIRILKPGGQLVLRVWDFWTRKDFPLLLLKYTFLKLIGRSKLDFKDVFVPWKNSNGKMLVNRYFHCFTKKEIERLIKEVGFEISKSWRAGKDPKTNIYLIVQKPL